MNPLIIAVAGKKLAGKSTLCNYLARFYAVQAVFPNKEINLFQHDDGTFSARYTREGLSLPIFLDDKSFDLERDRATVYSFADPLKQMICQGVLGLTLDQTYGTNEHKNSPTPYHWDNLPIEIRMECSDEVYDVFAGCSQWEIDEIDGRESTDVEIIEHIKKPRSGVMTAREVMQVVGTNIFRRFFSERVWVDATFRLIQSQKPTVALIADCRFKSEVDAVVNAGGYVIRPTRTVCPDDLHQSEIDLDDYPFEKLGERVLTIDNQNCSMADKNAVALGWFKILLAERNKDARNTVVNQV
jgi:hypothetical protein